MELREVMQKRKSIRQYLTTPVEEEKVKAMIEAAILAPTWKNAQEIRYYVAVSEEKRQAVPAERFSGSTAGADVLFWERLISRENGVSYKAPFLAGCVGECAGFSTLF